jgi:tRNA pseudouridine13 synthase
MKRTHFGPDHILSYPCITDHLPGIGGTIKAEPAHFVVEEIPLYHPGGEGEHIYVRLTREGWTTRDLTKKLADLFGLHLRDIGCAGLKDKHAQVTQTFSLRLHKQDPETVVQDIEDALPVKVHWARRHRNKLKPGHLLANSFHIVVLDPEPGAMEQASIISEALDARGLPNYFGRQRFGMRGDNAERGRRILLGQWRPRQRWRRRFLLFSYQSALFNLWLKERIERGWFEQLLTGDIAKKVRTGGLFEVTEIKAEQPRFEERTITYTGPIYGSRMRWATGEPGKLERKILEGAGITTEMLHRAGLSGNRRPARLFVDDLTIEPHAQGLLFSFTLPKGSYATNVLREFMKAESDLAEEG